MTSYTNSIVESIITKLQDISLEQQQQILDYVEFIAEKYSVEQDNLKQSPKKRILGLHKGKMWISDDFNEPLPDEFWGFDA